MSSANFQRKLITINDQQLAERCARGRIVIIDDDPEILNAIAALLELEGYATETYTSATDYLHVLTYNRPYFPGPSCVLCDVKMPGLDGLQLQNRLAELADTPLLLMSGASSVEEAVSAFRAGVVDFLLKPIDADTLLNAVAKALLKSSERAIFQHRHSELAERIATLTNREREIARRVAHGQINREIADTLNIALRTVKLHRQRAFNKLGVRNTADLVRIADEANL